MSDDKKPEPQAMKVIATQAAFYGGQLVQPGDRLTVVARKLPKWAQSASEPYSPPPQRSAADLKPKAAQVAVRNKGAALSGHEPS